MKIGIVGSGYVGKNTGKMMAGLGHEVLYHDALPGVLDILKSDGLDVEYDIGKLVKETDVQFVCVPTPPTADGKMDDTYITEVARA